MADIQSISLFIMNNLETLAIIFLSRLSILPEMLFGLYKCDIITLEEIDDLESNLHLDCQGITFAKEVCRWISDYITKEEISNSNRIYTLRIFVQYLNLSYVNTELRKAYLERNVNIDDVLD